MVSHTHIQIILTSTCYKKIAKKKKEKNWVRCFKFETNSFVLSLIFFIDLAYMETGLFKMKLNNLNDLRHIFSES